MLRVKKSKRQIGIMKKEISLCRQKDPKGLEKFLKKLEPEKEVNQEGSQK